ncbi:hypothetical protein BDV93DRAFT_526350, partial [Ceratobasidium sp. AG-I]
MASPYAGLTRTNALAHPLAEDEEEEITYVTLELGAVDPGLIPNCSSMRLVGLETPTPFLQLGDSVFKGIHVANLGSELLFNDATPDGPSRSLTSLAQTEHKILFNPVTLTPKPAPEAEPESEPASEAPRDPETPGPASGGGALTQPTAGQGLRDAAPVRLAGRPRGRGKGKGRARRP